MSEVRSPDLTSTQPSPSLRDEVQAAAARLDGRVRRTPVLAIEDRHFGRVALKLESLQLSGSFKVRGAMNRILVDEGRHGRVVAASGGNHGVAVAETCQRLGLPADIFVPASASRAKTRRISAAGAQLHLVDAPFADVEARCQEFGRAHGALFVHPYDDPGVISGQGTIGLELLDQMPNVDTVFVAVGGGGLAAGLAAALDPGVHIVAVEPELCPTLTAALAAGRPVEAPIGGAAADALGAPALGQFAYEVLSRRLTGVTTVSEDEIRAAQALLWDRCRLVVEPAAACAFAGFLRHGGGPGSVVIVCGGNVELPSVRLEL